MAEILQVITPQIDLTISPQAAWEHVGAAYQHHVLASVCLDVYSDWSSVSYGDLEELMIQELDGIGLEFPKDYGLELHSVPTDDCDPSEDDGGKLTDNEFCINIMMKNDESYTLFKLRYGLPMTKNYD